MAGISGFRGRRGAHKNARAKVRNAERKRENIARMPTCWRDRGLTAWDRLNELDTQHGVGKGAAKERRKLLAAADRDEQVA